MTRLTFGAFIPQGWKMELAVHRRRRRPSGPRPSRSPCWPRSSATTRSGSTTTSTTCRVPAHEAMFECWTTMAAISQRTVAHPARPDGRLRAVPQPGAAGEDHLHHRRDLAAAASTGASAPAGTTTSSRATATSSRRPKDRIGMLRETVEIVKAHVDRARRHLRGPALHARRARSATRSRCSSRTRRSGSAAAASSSRCGSSPATPTALELRRQAPRVGAQVRGAQGPLRGGRAATTTRSPRRGRPRCSSARPRPRSPRPAPRAFWGEPVESWRAGNLVGTPEQVAEKIAGLRRPRLHRLRPVVLATTPTPRPSACSPRRSSPTSGRPAKLRRWATWGSTRR